LIKGVLTEKKNLDGLPEFDTLLSGNDNVLTWAENNGIKASYIHRSDGYLCSGTEIRSILHGYK